MCGSNAGALEVGAIEVGVLGSNTKIGLQWNVCGSNAEAIEVRAIEVGVLRLSNGRDGGGVCVIQMLGSTSTSYKSRGLGVEQREGVAVECVWFKCRSY